MSDSGMNNIKILLLICESRNTAFFRKLTVVFCEEYLEKRSNFWTNRRNVYSCLRLEHPFRRLIKGNRLSLPALPIEPFVHAVHATDFAESGRRRWWIPWNRKWRNLKSFPLLLILVTQLIFRRFDGNFMSSTPGNLTKGNPSVSWLKPSVDSSGTIVESRAQINENYFGNWFVKFFSYNFLLSSSISF